VRNDFDWGVDFLITDGKERGWEIAPKMKLKVLPNAPADQQAAFEALLARKRGLWWAVVAFGLAMLCLGALIVVALVIVA
jgi:hypothetical protein